MRRKKNIFSTPGSSIYKVESTDKSCLQRQVREGANLAASDADNI